MKSIDARHAINAIHEFLNSTDRLVLSETTQANYRFILQSFEEYLIKNNKQDKTMRQLIDTLPDFTVYLREHKKSGKSIQQYVTIVKMLFRLNKVPIDYTYKIPTRDKKKLQLKRINRWFGKSDVDKCLAYQFSNNVDESIRLRNMLLVRLVIETGARIQEISHITYGDVDFTNNTIMLRFSKTEPRPAFYSETTNLIFDKLFNSFSGDNERKFNRNNISDENIFPSTDQSKKIITAMLNELGLKKKKDGRGPHNFRHYFATHLYYEGGMDLNDLAIVLGDTPDIVRENYLHPTPEMLRKKVVVAWGWE